MIKQTHVRKARHQRLVSTLALGASLAVGIPLGIAAELPHPSESLIFD
jgi:hypothetical protein